MDYGSACVSNRQSVILREYFMLNHMINHYDKLIEENNNPVHDSTPFARIYESMGWNQLYKRNVADN